MNSPRQHHTDTAVRPPPTHAARSSRGSIYQVEVTNQALAWSRDADRFLTGDSLVDYFTSSIAIVAGLCLAFGGLYVFFGIRRELDRTRNISLS